MYIRAVNYSFVKKQFLICQHFTKDLLHILHYIFEI